MAKTATKRKPKTARPPERQYGTGEAALKIGCCPAHLRLLIRRGKIKATRVESVTPVKKLATHTYVVGESEIERFLAESNPRKQGWPRGKPRTA